MLSSLPYYLSYFNEIVWDWKQAYKLLADSNTGWGQDYWYLAAYKSKNSMVKVNLEFPVSGRIVVSVNRLVGFLILRGIGGYGRILSQLILSRIHTLFITYLPKS